MNIAMRIIYKITQLEFQFIINSFKRLCSSAKENMLHMYFVNCSVRNCYTCSEIKYHLTRNTFKPLWQWFPHFYICLLINTFFCFLLLFIIWCYYYQCVTCQLNKMLSYSIYIPTVISENNFDIISHRQNKLIITKS